MKTKTILVATLVLSLGSLSAHTQAAEPTSNSAIIFCSPTEALDLLPDPNASHFANSPKIPYKAWTAAEQQKVISAFEAEKTESPWLTAKAANGRPIKCIRGTNKLLTSGNELDICGIVMHDEYFRLSMASQVECIRTYLFDQSDEAHLFAYSEPWVKFCTRFPQEGFVSYSSALRQKFSLIYGKPKWFKRKIPFSERAAFNKEILPMLKKSDPTAGPFRITYCEGLHQANLKNIKGAIPYFDKALTMNPTSLLPDVFLSELNERVQQDETALVHVHTAQKKLEFLRADPHDLRNKILLWTEIRIAERQHQTAKLAVLQKRFKSLFPKSLVSPKQGQFPE